MRHEQLYDRSMPLFEARDAEVVLKAVAVDAGQPFTEDDLEGR